MYCRYCRKEFNPYVFNGWIIYDRCLGHHYSSGNKDISPIRYCVNCGISLNPSHRLSRHGNNSDCPYTNPLCPSCRDMGVLIPEHRNQYPVAYEPSLYSFPVHDDGIKVANKYIIPHSWANRYPDRLVIIRECSCIKDKKHKHHPDYNKPLEIMLLCSKCHGAEHRRINQARSFNAIAAQAAAI